MKKKDKGPDNVRQPISLQLLLNKKMNTLLAFSGDNAGDIDKAVHDIRKSLKDIMAVLMLYKKHLTGIQFFTWKQMVKGILKQYSSLRDPYIFIETLKGFDGKIKEHDANSFNEIKNHLELRYLFKVKQNLKENIQLANEQAVLFSEDIRNSQVAVSISDLKKRNKQTLKKARQLLGKLTLISTSRDYHTLRKWCKYYDYQQTIFDKLGVEKVSAKERKRFHKLTEYLGNEHDLQVFYEYLQLHFVDFSELAKPIILLKIKKIRKKILAMYPKI